MKKLLSEFKDFALKGNMIDLAVGVIIGGAFNSLVKSLVENIVMPALSLLTGRIDFTNKFIALNGQHYATLEEAKAVTSTISYGLFITEVINFLIMAFVIFLVVKQLNKLHKPAPAPEPHEKTCPFCKTKIDLDAVRCRGGADLAGRHAADRGGTALRDGNTRGDLGAALDHQRRAALVEIEHTEDRRAAHVCRALLLHQTDAAEMDLGAQHRRYLHAGLDLLADVLLLRDGLYAAAQLKRRSSCCKGR